jgi:YVTN family beta-propeller protein
MRRLVPVLATCLLATVFSPLLSPASADPPLRSVMFVGNNWDGTATVVTAKTYKVLHRFNVIPDRQERLLEIYSNPDKLAFYLAIQQGVGEGHDQYVDDMFSTNDGRMVAISRPSFADVIGMDLATGAIRWRFPMEGYRSDHMAVSPDGLRLLVSDSTANKVHELDIQTGQKLREFPSGDSPHENNYSKDGSKIFHASIGRVYLPTDRDELGPAREASKGAQYFQIVDNDSFSILKRWDMGQKLAEAGYPGMASAVRPMAIAPDERYAYVQVSFFHGFVEFDMQQEKVLRLAHLPDRTNGLPREQYVLDSAHHGMAMNEAGTKICAAGTMDDYAAIVSRQTFSYQLVEVGSKPYWSTTGPDGKKCWVSVSGGDKVVVIDYATAQQIAEIPVGDHPQRVRHGYVARDAANQWPGAEFIPDEPPLLPLPLG